MALVDEARQHPDRGIESSAQRLAEQMVKGNAALNRRADDAGGRAWRWVDDGLPPTCPAAGPAGASPADQPPSDDGGHHHLRNLQASQASSADQPSSSDDEGAHPRSRKAAPWRLAVAWRHDTGKCVDGAPAWLLGDDDEDADGDDGGDESASLLRGGVAVVASHSGVVSAVAVRRGAWARVTVDRSRHLSLSWGVGACHY
jgi:hypothetical protein